MPDFSFSAAYDGSMYVDNVTAQHFYAARHLALQKAVKWFNISLELNEECDESLLDGFQIAQVPLNFTEANVETAMCLWEAVLDNRNDPDHLFAFDQQGTVVIRHQIIDLVPAAEELWNWMRHHQVEDPYVPYDWEFCPMFIRDCTTWDETGVHLAPEKIRALKQELLA